MANVAVLPKQQVQIRASLVARSMPLGLLDETQVDEWVKAQQLDELTFTSANTLLEYLSVLPITRPASQAHLPMSATRILMIIKGIR